MTTDTTAAQHGATVRQLHAKKRVLVRLDMFHKECKRFGLDTQGDVVAALGITRTTLWRVERTQEVQADFIAACLTVFYKARFDDLFEIPAP